MTLASLRQRGHSLRVIAGVLNRSASTLSRELQRNSSAQTYVVRDARGASTQRRRAARQCPKLHPDLKLWRVVKTCLSGRWSLQQISRILAHMWPDEPDMQVSHEPICAATYVQAGGELRRQLIACLRQGKSVRKPCSAGAERRGRIPDMVSVHVRPPDAEDRVMP